MARHGRSEDWGGPSRWWLAKGEAISSGIWGWVDRLRSQQRAEELRDRIHEAIYVGRPLGTRTDAHPGIEKLRAQASAPANLNITRSMVDTVCSRLGKRRPMPVISADDAEFTEKLFAKQASRVIRRKMGHPKIERMRPMILRDALIKCTGVVHVFRNGGDVDVERVPRHEILVDPTDAQYGDPRVLARIKAVHCDVLCEMFPSREADIHAATRVERDSWNPRDSDGVTDTDMVDVAEAWHLPSGPEAKDGSRAIVIRGMAPLLVERWNRPRYPFAFLHWSPPLDGFWGDGLVEQLCGIQAKVNDLARDTQEALYFGAMLKVFQPRGANINKNHLRARHPVVIETDGAVPSYVAPNPVSQQQIEFLQWLMQQAYEISGISQAAAASKNPLGSNASGKALDTMYDIESDRFSGPELAYAMLAVDLGQCVLDEARDIIEDRDMPRREKAPWIVEIEWNKIDVDGGNYHLVLEPVNFLPESRAGRLSTVKEMADAGLLQDQLQTLALFDEPDMARANRYQLGPYRNLERIMGDLANKTVPLEECTPDPLVLAAAPGKAKTMALGEYNAVMADGADDEVLGRFRWFLSMLGAEEAMESAPPPPPPPPEMGAPPPGPPMGPPGMGPEMMPPGMGPPGMPPPDQMPPAGQPMPPPPSGMIQ